MPAKKCVLFEATTTVVTGKGRMERRGVYVLGRNVAARLPAHMERGLFGSGSNDCCLLPAGRLCVCISLVTGGMRYTIEYMNTC